MFFAWQQYNVTLEDHVALFSIHSNPYLDPKSGSFFHLWDLFDREHQFFGKKHCFVDTVECLLKNKKKTFHFGRNDKLKHW